MGTVAGATPPEGDTLAAVIDRYRVQSHYLFHYCWLAHPSLAQRCAMLAQVPVAMLHGRDDRVCPLARARELARKVPRLRWVELDGVGHDPTAPAMQAAMREVLAGLARRGHFDAA